jgi:hypothetical protein
LIIPVSKTQKVGPLKKDGHALKTLTHSVLYFFPISNTIISRGENESHSGVKVLAISPQAVPFLVGRESWNTIG